MGFLKRAVLHPFLIAAYSVLALGALNLGKFNPWMALRSLVFFLLVIALAYWPLKGLTRSPYKSALVLSLVLLAFFSYGHIHNVWIGKHFLGMNLGWHRTQLAIWAVILIGGLVSILRTRRNLQNLTQALNLILIIVLFFPFFQFVRYSIQSKSQNTSPVAQASTYIATEYPALVKPEETVAPDIYYIILDTYARQDTLQKAMHFDNSDFISQLKQIGFYIADCSQSNYAITELSLSSSLNFNYLDVLGNNSKQIYTHSELYRLIQGSAVRQLLHKAGYQVIAFDTGYSPTNWEDADEFLTGSNEPFRTYFLGGINPFEALVLQTSMGTLIYDVQSKLPKTLRSFLDAAYIEHRERILFAFEKLETLPGMQSPKFVFVHILAPHSPFVFGPNGEIVGRGSPFTLNNDLEIADPKRYIEGYRNQLQYVNLRMIRILQEIIASSPNPPIIILQGDHGPKAGIASQSGRMEILNAYYLPGDQEILYETISPVNTFRVIFNQYFQEQFDLLPDISYYSTNQSPDVFTVYPNDPANCSP